MKVTKSDGTVVENVYDVDGVLVRTAVNGVGTDMLVDTSGGLSHVVAEVDSSGTISVLYVRAGDMLLEEVRGGVAKMYEADGLGSVRGLLDVSGAKTDTYAYEAFGSTVSSTGSDANPYRFAGERMVGSVGFYQNRARWLDTRVGRFVSIDPEKGSLEEPLSLQPYGYADGDPVALADPTGQFAEMMVTMAMYSNLAAASMAAPGTSPVTNSAQRTLIIYNDISSGRGSYSTWPTFNRDLFARGLKKAIGVAVNASLDAASIERVRSRSDIVASLAKGGYSHVIYYGHMPLQPALFRVLSDHRVISPTATLADKEPIRANEFAKMLKAEVTMVTLLSCLSESFAEELSKERSFAYGNVRGLSNYIHDWVSRDDSSDVHIWQDNSNVYKREWIANPPATKAFNLQGFPRIQL